MGFESFEKLEERINKAVSYIEELTKTNKQLVDEKKELTLRIGKLEKELKSMEAAVAKKTRSSSQVTEQVKEKIQGLLDRIESFEKSMP